MRVTRFILALLGFATISIVGAQDSYLLRYKFEPNKIIFFQVKAHVAGTMSGMMGSEEPQEMGMDQSLLMKYKIAGVKDGVGTIINTFTKPDFKVTFGGNEMPAPGSAAEDIEKMVTTIKMNDRGEVTDSKTEGMPQSMMQMNMAGPSAFSFSTFLPTFPAAALKVGESWTCELPNPMGSVMAAGGSKIKLAPVKCKALLVGLDTSLGIPVYKITAEFEIPVDMDMSKLEGNQAPEGMSMAMKGNTVIKSTIFLERETCLPVSVKFDFDNNIAMTMSGGPVDDMKMQITMKGAADLNRTKDEKAPAGGPSTPGG